MNKAIRPFPISQFVIGKVKIRFLSSITIQYAEGRSLGDFAYSVVNRNPFSFSANDGKDQYSGSRKDVLYIKKKPQSVLW